MSEVIAYIALGSNLGNRLEFLRAAVRELQATPQIRVTGFSSIYETDPVGGPAGQGAFLNAVVRIVTSLTGAELLARMQNIEAQNQRQRIEAWGPRTLDLDLLLFGAEKIQTQSLVVPHPRLTERSFVLFPLHDLAPELIVTGQKLSVSELLNIADKNGITVTDYTFFP